jgi:hypothetical protein
MTAMASNLGRALAINSHFIETIGTKLSLQRMKILKNNHWGPPGIEPGTSRTLSENYTTKPRALFVVGTARDRSKYHVFIRFAFAASSI